MVDKKMRVFPHNLRDLMKRDRVTQAVLASKLAISRPAIPMPTLKYTHQTVEINRAWG